MRMTWRISIALLAGLVLSLACSKVNEQGTENPEEKEKPAENVTIKVSIPEEGLTRVAFEEAMADKSGGMKLTWESSDALVINEQTFSIDPESISDDGKTANFIGPLIETGPYDISYNGGDFANAQEQAADAATSHLKYVVSLTGVDAYQDIQFTSAWASSHLGTLTQSSVFRIRAQMPDGVAQKVKDIKILAVDADGNPAIVFGSSNELTLTLTNVGDTDGDKILDLYANLPTGAKEIPANTAFFVRFRTTDRDATDFAYTRYHTFTSALTLTPGTVNALNLNCRATEQHAGSKSTCDGSTADKAYLIGDRYQMQAMRGLMNPNVTTYFKLIDEIDLKGEDWEPLNYDNSFTRGIYFDGQNHTVTNLVSYGANSAPSGHSGYGYPSFVGVLNGTIKNVTFDGVTITAGNDKAGAIGGYLGTTNIVGQCDGVTVKNVSITGTNYIGGFGGQIANAGNSFTDCHVIDATITQEYGTADSDRSTGGFAGHASKAASYTDCSVKATVMQGLNKTINGVGGFIGRADGGASSFINCQVLAGSLVSGHKYVGGFVGYNVKASTYDNCVTYADVSSDGDCLGGFVGKSDAGKFGNTTPCVAAGTVEGTGVSSYYVGGFVGLSGSTSYKACSYQGTSVSSEATESGKSAVTGGFCGRTDGVSGDSFVDCFVYNSASGTTVSASLQRIGGFIGQSGAGTSANLGTFDGCYVKNVTVVPGDKNSGGFVGVCYVPLNNCHVDGGSIKAAGVSTGGFAGHVEKVNLTGCYSTMTVNANGKSDIGGLIGYLASAQTISKCYYSGNINANGQAHGGIVGHVGNVAAIIENCYSTGNLTTTSGVQIHGGIVGELGTGGTVRNCYSTMTITGGRVLGGIVGRAASGGWNYEGSTNNTVSKCIAFNPSVSASQVGSYGSSGAIVGVTSIKNVLEDCYRLYNMAFVNSNQWGNTMVDQVNCNGTNWTRDPATGTGDGNQCAYFGIAAATDATVKSIAQTLGWDSTVWDFTGDLPTLK